MNHKLELYDKLLCMGCLCVGQTLEKIAQKKHRDFYMASLSEIGVEFLNLVPSMCVECSNMLKRAVAFREQIQNSFKLLQTYPDENLTDYLNVSTPCALENATKDLFTEDQKVVKDENCIDHIEIIENRDPTVSEQSDGDSMDIPISFIKNEKLKLEESNNLTESLIEKGRTASECEMCIFDDGNKIKQEDGIHLETKYSATVTNSCEKVESNTKKVRKRRKIEQKITPESLDVKNMEKTDLSLSDDVNNDFEENDENGDNLHVFDDDKNTGHSEKCVTNTFRVTKKKKRKPIKKKRDSTKDSPSPFITIDLSPEEMNFERVREKEAESYLKAEFKCETCITKFSHESRFKEHLKKRHSPSIGDYVCPVCSTVFNTLDAFTSHYKRHMKRYECTICKRRTTDVKAMHHHCYAEHNMILRQYKCSKCAFTTCSINALRYHKESHRSRVKCSHCEKTFSHRAGLMNHTLAFHGGRNSFPCEECGAQFRWKASLRRHAVKHHAKSDGESPERARCIQCDISFSSVSSYQRHLKNSLKHVRQEDLRYICDHCNRRFADKTKLRDHIEEKHLFKTFQCHICNKPSKNRVGLDQHIRNVHKRRPNNKICHHCGKGFPTTMQLESHIRTHTGERPFICEFCPTTFSQQSNLYKHNRQVHLNIKSKRATQKTKDKLELAIDSALAQNQNQHGNVPVPLYCKDSDFSLC